MIVSCSNCKKEFEKLPNQVAKSSNHFCSRSCSATFNNKKSKKRKRTKKCETCENLSLSNKKYCEECSESRLEILKNQRLCDIRNNKHMHSLIRHRAKAVVKPLNWTNCKFCDYNKHIEICHIKPISEFSPQDLISEINSVDNLIGLCPNCHWEFDNGLINRSPRH